MTAQRAMLLAGILLAVGVLRVHGRETPKPIKACAFEVGKQCPLNGQYYFCQEGKDGAGQGCRRLAQGPWPAARCSKQCIHEYVPPCQGGVGTVCPKNGQRYFYCQNGTDAPGGCRPVAQNAFPSAVCSKQCVYRAFDVCKLDVGNECPLPASATGGVYYYCQKPAPAADSTPALPKPLGYGMYHAQPSPPPPPSPSPVVTSNSSGNSNSTQRPVGGCRPVAKGPFSERNCLQQCRFTKIATCKDYQGYRCPKTGQAYYFCPEGRALGGKQSEGCRPAALGPWSADDCAEQCVVRPDCPREGVDTRQCSQDGSVQYVCQAGKAKGQCRPLAEGVFPQVNCTEQCRYKARL